MAKAIKQVELVGVIDAANNKLIGELLDELFTMSNLAHFCEIYDEENLSVNTVRNTTTFKGRLNTEYEEFDGTINRPFYYALAYVCNCHNFDWFSGTVTIYNDETFSVSLNFD